jgi:hypothetical protein
MSHPSPINLEFVRKEAKALLKRCRAGDAAAIGRIRAGLTRLATLEDKQASMEIKLADVQHVLAREQGFPNWGSLKRFDDPLDSAPDYARPGSDGVLPDGYNPWRWGVTYTVRPEVLLPIVSGEEYRIGASVLRSMPDGESFGSYAHLYEHASSIVKARVAELTCGDSRQFLHTRILAQNWFRHGGTNLVRATVTIGVTCLNEGDAGPEGESIPTRDDLTQPGGMTAEQLTVSSRRKGFEELYSVSDVRSELDVSRIFLFSYGEYVKTADGIDYTPFLNRAEHRTRFYLRLLTGDAGTELALNIVRREWFCATNPDIVVIHIYVRL